MPRNPSDALLGVKFYTEAVEDRARTEEESRPIFRDEEYIEILIPGDAKTIVARRVEDGDKERFPDEYEAFKRRQDAPKTGTPLKEWGQLKASRVKELAASNIETVEQLAGIQQSAISRLGPGTQDEVLRAQAFLDQAKDAGAAGKYAVENEALKQDISALQTQIEDLQKKLADAEKSKK